MTILGHPYYLLVMRTIRNGRMVITTLMYLVFNKFVLKHLNIANYILCKWRLTKCNHVGNKTDCPFNDDVHFDWKLLHYKNIKQVNIVCFTTFWTRGNGVSQFH
uniref:Uncharacterized protein n=1 Tax=Cacopsylla melanoneura TaxID=428564 RepID=A0A8D8M6C2_9HEMI